MCDGNCKCKEKKINLLKGGVMHTACPYCGAADEYIILEEPELEGYMLEIEGRCTMCMGSWRDTYAYLGKRELLEEGIPMVFDDEPDELEYVGP